MKLLRSRFFGWNISVYTIMGMLVGIELDDDHRWISINLLLLKITITMDLPSLDPTE